MITLVVSPTVIAAALDNIDLLPLILSYISQPEFACLSVETELPGVAEAVGPNFSAAAAGREWIVKRV